MSALTAELLKLRTAPGLALGATVSAAALPLASMLVATSGGVTPDETLTASVATGSLAGLLGWGVWASAAAAGEHVHGTIVPSRVAVPDRGRLLRARLVAVAVVAAAGTGLAVVLGLGLVRAVLPSGDRPVGPLAALLLLPLVAAAVAVVGSTVGQVGRSVAGAGATVAAALLVPKAAAGLLGVLEPWVVGASPGTVVTQLVGGGQLPDAQVHPGGDVGAVATLGAVVALVVGLGVVVDRRRDG